jgi:fumarate reductase subunit D
MEPDQLSNSWLNFNAFWRVLIVPLIVWGAMMTAPLLAGQPGVVCMTPAAWLLALWSGGEYVRISAGRPGRWPLLGPALAGGVLGAALGLVFVLVSSIGMPPGDAPGEMSKAILLDAVMAVVGILVCAGFSVFTAWLSLRRMERFG